MHILIVEDDASIRDMLIECLSEEGYTVAAARQGQEALNLLHTSANWPDLILLDLTMPIMNGREFLAMLQQDEGLAAIPVVVFSADRSVQQQAELPASIATVAKPIDIDVLLELVASYRTHV